MLEELIDAGNWFSSEWFKPSTLQSFDWEHPIWLYIIPFVPLLLIVRWLLHYRFRQKLPSAFPTKELKWQASSLLRHIPPILGLMVLALLLTALARPQKTNEEVEQWSEGIDIMLIIDISQSMQIEDFSPNRLESAKEVARQFIKGRFQDRIGLVIFSGDAYSLAPLTTDYELLFTYIDEINFDKIENRGTAIGSALAVATNRMRESDSKSKVLILLSDGDNTAGNIDPITAAELASAFEIKMYTIGIGKEGQVPWGKDLFGRTNYVQSSLDETTLRRIAEIGDGKFYRVSNEQALQQVFQEIDEYEKVEIKESRFSNTTDFYSVYLTWGIVFLLIWLLTKSSFINNILED